MVQPTKWAGNNFRVNLTNENAENVKYALKLKMPSVEKRVLMNDKYHLVLHKLSHFCLGGACYLPIKRV